MARASKAFEGGFGEARDQSCELGTDCVFHRDMGTLSASAPETLTDQQGFSRHAVSVVRCGQGAFGVARSQPAFSRE
ncbi:MAG: hypothetical protein EBV24_10865 [Actinobacteria bacterium]|nr:hypothetical protein [Actinomycetota bacterium]